MPMFQARPLRAGTTHSNPAQPGFKSRPWPVQAGSAAEAFARAQPPTGARGWPARAGAMNEFTARRGTTSATGGTTLPGKLPEHLQAGIEALSGVSMADVTVHHESPHPAAFEALALVQSNEIHIGPGQDEHLPHEAWHVAQQRQGRVPSSGQRCGVSLNQDPTLEREADEMGARADRDGPLLPGAPSALAAAALSTDSPVQLKISAKNSPTIDTKEALDELISELTQGQGAEYRGLVQWFLTFCYDVDYVFSSSGALFDTVEQLKSEWEDELTEIGVTKKEIPTAHHMYNLLGAARPDQDEAILHKIIYPSLKSEYVETRGGGQEAMRAKGLVYNPEVKGEKNTMPLNFSWLVGVANRGLTIRIVVPVTRRVLVRPIKPEKAEPSLTNALPPQDASQQATPSQDEVKVPSGVVTVPLSATAREILGLLRGKFYTLSGDSTDAEKILKPTEKARRAMPKDVQIEEDMPIGMLTAELAKYGIEIESDEVATSAEAEAEKSVRARTETEQKKFGQGSQFIGNLPESGPEVRKLEKRRKETLKKLEVRRKKLLENRRAGKKEQGD
jgi:hypothetical protein